ncbi:MAG: tRNA (adenosine(37)-N6)-dimethylallyltransferase MiaA, partial [Deltaproteobacteria bacterium]
QEFFPWIEGSRTLEEAIRLFKRNTRRYAKRQMTWFRKYLQGRQFAGNASQPILSWLEATIR